MSGVDELLHGALEVQSLLSRNGWRFCFIGGIAVQRWGNPRFTQDIDLTLLTGFGSEEVFIDSLFRDLVPRRADAREFALKNRVLLVCTQSGIDVDIALGALPFEERTIARATRWQIANKISLMTCSAEDLLTHKVFASRHIDWADAEQILTRQFGKLDLALVRRELEPLLELKGEAVALNKLDLLVETVSRRFSAT